MKKEDRKKGLLIAWGIYAALCLAYSFAMKINFGDETAFYAGKWTLSGLIPYVKWFDESWSSRLIINVVLTFLANHNYMIFRILNTAVMVMGTFFLTRITKMQRQTGGTLIVMAAFFGIPALLHSSAGWIATTTNYLWPLSFGLWVVDLLIRDFEGQKASIAERIVILPFFRYAIESEQVCLMGLFFLAVYGGLYVKKKRKVPAYASVLFVITLATMIYELTCTGNASRDWMGDIDIYTGYEMKGFFAKIYYGFDATWNMLLEDYLLVVPFAFSWICFGGAVLKGKAERAAGKATSGEIVAVVTAAFFTWCVAKRMMGSLDDSGVTELNVLNAVGISIYKKYFIRMLFTGCILGTAFAAGEGIRSWVYVGILLLGFGTSLAGGLTSSVYASYCRPMFFLFFGMQFIAADILIQNRKRSKWLICIGSILFVLELVSNVIFYVCER